MRSSLFVARVAHVARSTGNRDGREQEWAHTLSMEAPKSSPDATRAKHRLESLPAQRRMHPVSHWGFLSPGLGFRTPNPREVRALYNTRMDGSGFHIRLRRERMHPSLKTRHRNAAHQSHARSKVGGEL